MNEIDRVCDDMEATLLARAEKAEAARDKLAAQLAALREAGVGARITIEAAYADAGRDPANNDNYCRLVDALSSPSPLTDAYRMAMALAKDCIRVGDKWDSDTWDKYSAFRTVLAKCGEGAG